MKKQREVKRKRSESWNDIGGFRGGIALKDIIFIEYRHQWIIPVILALGRLKLGGSWFQASPSKKFLRPHLQNN
jgi:hypothetical protein